MNNNCQENDEEDEKNLSEEEKDEIFDPTN